MWTANPAVAGFLGAVVGAMVMSTFEELPPKDDP